MTLEQGIQGNCKTCSGRDESEQCVQNFYVDIDPFNDADIGCGVSLANVNDHMDPLPVSFLCFLSSLLNYYRLHMENQRLISCQSQFIIPITSDFANVSQMRKSLRDVGCICIRYVIGQPRSWYGFHLLLAYSYFIIYS